MAASHALSQLSYSPTKKHDLNSRFLLNCQQKNALLCFVFQKREKNSRFFEITHSPSKPV
ncbi:hypothetical protein MTBBW1_130009 [Desulfamplus magnetovallimortis]|uniref:Uncharacterized protein n=1 Tax=Desulfamplus magnetovallimortis TaxID=1246637 RepID=A0A1W1H732_9BACT|nr:hypothetical protein MTBBW1_130009 [Desulfamplus magnetovallimortis]